MDLPLSVVQTMQIPRILLDTRCNPTFLFYSDQGYGTIIGVMEIQFYQTLVEIYILVGLYEHEFVGGCTIVPHW